ncbi:MAG TPA: cytochrome c1 [Rhodospirillaceae bacterium]|nr:cytochrome c1 [Rhodospirillaceae bacterium]HAA93198.1 cytochrome c1 [Rhodospirillaceae bacterium]HAT34072.1 cytochrome c1 [Rhodospirillaceae bacterium]
MQLKTLKAALAACLLFSATAATAAEKLTYEKQDWSWQGIFGTYDRAQLQRGLQVFKEVCAACHALNYVAFRNLSDLGYSKKEIQAFAKTFEVTNAEPNDEGEIFKRPGKSNDYFPPPFPNVQAARAANGGAYPPNLSLMVEARANGADYIYALMTGYKEPPKDVKMNEGMSYNVAFPGHQIAMGPPLSEGSVEYADGTKPTLNQLATDVTAFLAWAAEPNLEARKRMGFKVLLFLFAFLAILIAMKKRTWADVH